MARFKATASECELWSASSKDLSSFFIAAFDPHQKISRHRCGSCPTSLTSTIPSSCQVELFLRPPCRLRLTLASPQAVRTSHLEVERKTNLSAWKDAGLCTNQLVRTRTPCELKKCYPELSWMTSSVSPSSRVTMTSCIRPRRRDFELTL